VLAAYEATRARRADTQLLLVGDGPMRAALHARCPQAVFAGHRGSDDLAAHYASADVFLFPSLTETFGNVTTEAMASGLPVVAFDSAAAGQLIEPGRNGLLAAGHDHEAFVRAALLLHSDALLRQTLGAAARATACRIDWRSVVGRFENVLSRVIDSRDAMQTELAASVPGGSSQRRDLRSQRRLKKPLREGPSGVDAAIWALRVNQAAQSLRDFNAPRENGREGEFHV
jgi:hypothetical protein